MAVVVLIIITLLSKWCLSNHYESGNITLNYRFFSLAVKSLFYPATLDSSAIQELTTLKIFWQGPTVNFKFWYLFNLFHLSNISFFLCHVLCWLLYKVYLFIFSRWVYFFFQIKSKSPQGWYIGQLRNTMGALWDVHPSPIMILWPNFIQFQTLASGV